MNKDLLNQLPADEQPIASKLDSVAEDMKLSPSFQWKLENQLMDAYKTQTQPSQGWHTKMIPALGWAALAIGAIFLFNWAMRSQAPDVPPAAPATSVSEMSFEASVRQGNICAGPLALAHGFSAFITNEDKTSFVPLDTADSIGEVRSIAWSPDGKQLAVIGNTTGSGTIYITEPTGGQIEYILSGSEVGYLWDAAWSRDGRQLVIWSSPNNALYLLNSDGAGLVEKQVSVQILGKPQFAPDGKGVVFYGGDMTATGLFQFILADSQLTLINPSVEDESGFTFSPNGSRLAYIEYDRDDGEARLFTADTLTGERAILGILPIPKKSGSSLPESASLSWSVDGDFLMFEIGRNEEDRAVYLAFADGTGLIKVADAAHAPSISSDGRCLAYISNEQVFLIDLAGISATATIAPPVLLADLPAGRSNADFKLDKLQWRP
ncbi:MAG TPA: hypothetical protein VK897_08730 [Anaerolineales bacterium]|nr:hypothetical protein [Anaerolineales bacterium]